MSSTSITGIEPVAQAGFEQNVDLYENARPSYPPAAISHLESVLELMPNQSHVVDLGAGTGKLTRLLLSNGYRHLEAIEPAAAMREKFEQILPSVQILNANSWNMPIPTNSQDAVICAQAFHWFANLNTLREVHRVLKPGGGFAMIWNMEDRTDKEWVGELRDYYEQFELDSPQFRLGLWKHVWEEDEAKSLFSQLQFEKVNHFLYSTKETIRQRILSKSYIACQAEEKQAEISMKLMQILEDAVDIDYDQNGLVSFPYLTEMVWCKKLEKSINFK